MRNVCPQCASKILELGYPAYILMEKTCGAFVNQGCIVFTDYLPTEHTSPKGFVSVRETLSFLENKGYLISFEVSQLDVAIIPNITRSWFHPEIEAFCFHMHD